ncbi:hypothetical protein BH09BAC3_BH09BAC3_23870 [soil metagenome]
MTKKFWPVLISLVVILAALCLLRVSSFKVTEQNVIALLQAQQSFASIKFFQIISDYGKYINIGVPAIVLLMGVVHKRKDFIQKGLIILLAMALSGIIAQSIKRTVKEPRPYEVDARITQYSVGGSNSFPSGHTAETVAATMGIALVLFRTPLSIVISMIWALLMMSSRIVLGVHNFTDIIGGFVTASIGLWIVYSLFEKYWPIPIPSSPSRLSRN